MKKPELLAPAGSIDALKAAVWAGADAVYLGGQSFNARAFADNFSDDVFGQALSFCRLYGVKVYVTLNTLVTDKEIPKVLEYVDMLESDCPPDGYIIQDLGLVSSIKEKHPDVTIHASTQMQQHNRYCAEHLKSMGISRVVLARECSVDDISAVVSTGIETEVFIHGAVCVCQSGGCLMSSVIGGRSGNRGACAQPCRQMYNNSYPLSLKDMCLARHIPELISLGVSCLKIEGRMKSPEYVYQTVKIYRALIDECRSATAEELRLLEYAFSRSGFSDGYYVNIIGQRMFGIRTETDKEKSRSLDIKVSERKINVKIKCVIEADKPSFVCATGAGTYVEFFGDVPEKAINRPITCDEVEKRLGKTGGTPFTALVEAHVEDGVILPISSLNELRREVLTLLKDRIIKNNSPVKKALPFLIERKVNNQCNSKSYVVARFEGRIPSAETVKALLATCDRVDLPLWLPMPKLDEYRNISLVLPRVIMEKDITRVKALLSDAKSKGIGHLTVSNFSHLNLCKDFMVHGDYSLNVVNSRTTKVMGDMGFSSLTVSPELSPSMLKMAECCTEYIAYGRIPVMHTENCIISNTEKCAQKEFCVGALTDKTGASFPVIREFSHRNTIYNSVPCYLLDKINELRGINGYILLFTTESDEDVFDIIKCYKLKAAPQMKFTRGALKREGGVFSR